MFPLWLNMLPENITEHYCFGHSWRRDVVGRNVNWPAGMYSTLAGFVEAGESIEQTVHREVLEEVGLQVKELKYFGSQLAFPKFSDARFSAEYKSGE